MNEKIEGTFVIDGLLEGRVPPIPGAEQKLHDWISFARQAKLRFNLETDGNAFSLLADNSAQNAAAIGPDPAEIVASALREMLKVFPPADRARVYSTLRSVEYQKGREVQTLYRILSDGSLDAQSRTVEARTAAPPAPLTRKERLRLGLTGLLIAVGIFGISSIFIDYPGLWRQFRNSVTSVSAEKLAVEAPAFADYFTVAGKKIVSDGKGNSILILTLKRTARMPLKPADFDASTTRPSFTFEQRLILESVARGYVRAELFDEKGQFQASDTIRIQPLRQAESAEIAIPLLRDPRTYKVVLVY